MVGGGGAGAQTAAVSGRGADRVRLAAAGSRGRWACTFSFFPLPTMWSGCVRSPCIRVHQITLAVLVCGWAHVLHAMYKPWGSGTVMYALQHGSLFVTSFVFLMVGALAATFDCAAGVVCLSSEIVNSLPSVSMHSGTRVAPVA